MSRFDTQAHRSDIICPYCGYDYQVETEDFLDEDDAEIEECGDCGKKFHRSTNYSITHEARPDCELNGEAHKFEEKPLGGGRTHPFCSVCGEIEPIKR